MKTIASAVFTAIISTSAVYSATQITPLTQDGWQTGTGRSGRPTFVVDTATGEASLTNSNWSQAYASLDLTATPIVADKDLGEAISFSLVINSNDVDQNMVVALCDTTDSKVLVFGAPMYKTNTAEPYVSNMAVGTSTNATANFYSHESGGVSNLQNLVDNYTAGTDYTISGLIRWSNSAGEWLADVSCGDITIANISLGENFQINRIQLSGDGKNGITNGSIKAMKLEIVPEPATATLGLLALSGLAARRRRK